MSWIHLPATDPSVRAIVQRAFPGWKGRSFVAVIADSVRFYGTMWDGGERRTYAAVRLADMGVVTIAQEQFAVDSAAHRTDWPIPDGVVVVVRCEGRWEHIEIIGNSSVVNPMLPAPVELTIDERIVLAAICSLKSSYAGIPNYRAHQARQYTGITQERYDAAKATLTARGFLNKAGAATTEGRNARGRDDLCMIGIELRKAESAVTA